MKVKTEFTAFKLGDKVRCYSNFPGKLGSSREYIVVDLIPASAYENRLGYWEPCLTVIGDNGKQVTAHFYRFYKEGI